MLFRCTTNASTSDSTISHLLNTKTSPESYFTHERSPIRQFFFLSFLSPGFYVDSERSERVPEPSLLPAPDQELQEGPLGKDHNCRSECKPARSYTIEITFELLSSSQMFLGGGSSCDKSWQNSQDWYLGTTSHKKNQFLAQMTSPPNSGRLYNWKNDQKVSHNMIFMSKYKGQHGGKKGQKIRAGVSPLPFRAMPEREKKFLQEGFSKTHYKTKMKKVNVCTAHLIDPRHLE